MSQRSLEILAGTDRIDYGLVAAVVKHIVNTADTPNGAILLFMPGVMEIRQCVNELQAAALGNVEIMPLHANLSSAEQKRVFISTAPRRKIVVATNVAETSVTIPDVVYVVDGGRVKETQFDAETGMQRLVECWTSRASGRQRRGRAGRTQAGQVRDILLPLIGPPTHNSATSYTLGGQRTTRCLASLFLKCFVPRSKHSFFKSKL